MIKPIYKGEVGISHPASSGTAYTIIAGLVQLMGEEKGFRLSQSITQKHHAIHTQRSSTSA
jgi:iron(III) transport system substrate-binding protein